MKKARAAFGLLAAALMAGMGAKAWGTEDGLAKSGAREKVLRYVNYYPVAFDALDPMNLKDNTEYTIGYHVLEGLMRMHQYRLQYGMAEEYEISLDGCTYTFYIRENARYSDGTPVKAEDFRRAFLRRAEENPESKYIRILRNANEIINGELPVEMLGVEALDERTLVIQLEHSDSRFLEYLSLPEFAPRREGAGTYLRAEDCNGPFFLKENEGKLFCRMEKNPYYWDRDQIALDAIESVYYVGSEEACQALSEGKADIVPLAAQEDAEGYLGNTRRGMTGTCDNIYFDLGAESPLRYAALRLALNYALNREEYCACLDNGLIEPNARCVPAIGEGACQEYVDMFGQGFFPVKGEQKAAEANMKLALEMLGVDSPNEIVLPFYVHDDYWSKKEASLVADQWEKKLGIEIELIYIEGDKFADVLEKSGGMLLGSNGEAFANPEEYLKRWNYDYLPEDDNDHSGQFQKYISQAETQNDEQIRLSILYEAEKVLFQDAPFVPLQLRYEMLLINPNLTGFEISADFSGGPYDFIYADFN